MANSSLMEGSGTQKREFRWPLQNWFWLLALGMGVLLRFLGLGWDEAALLHPDERFLTSVILRVGWPEYATWFNSSLSPFNPANLEKTHYVYGQFPLLLGKYWALLTGAQTDSQFLVWGRLLAGLADTITVLCTVELGRKIFGLTGGLVAGALVALAPLGIQTSHFFTVDPFAACFLTLSWVCAGRWLEQKRARWAVAVGVCWGLACACKIASGVALIALLPLLVLAASRQGRKLAYGHVGLLCFSAGIAFRVFHPMAFRGEGWLGIFDVRLEPRFWRDMETQAAITAGYLDVPFNVQWIGRTDILFSLHNLGAWGWGWPLLLLSLAGLACYPFFPVRKGPPHAGLMWVFWFWGLAVLLIFGTQFSKFTRYFLVLTPLAGLFAVYWGELLSRRYPWARSLLPVTGLLCGFWALAVASIYWREHPRLTATHWIRANVPPGTVVINETAWDEGLPLSWVPAAPGEPHADGLTRLDLKVFSQDTPQKHWQILDTLEQAEWLFLSSPRAWSNIPRWEERWPATTSFYRALFAGKLGFKLEKEFTNYPRFGPFTFPDDGLEEALSVYDHPRVLLYKKTPDWSYQSAEKLLHAVQVRQDKTWLPAEATYSPRGPWPSNAPANSK